MLKPVYLDVCALCRPFDDQSFIRLRLESDAVKLILQCVRDGLLQMMLLPVHFREIGAFTCTAERIELLGIINNLGQKIDADAVVTRRRAEDLIDFGVGVADAAHVAFAESVGADFITCDDKLLKKSQKIKLNIWFGGPLEYCLKEKLK